MYIFSEGQRCYLQYFERVLTHIPLQIIDEPIKETVRCKYGLKSQYNYVKWGVFHSVLAKCGPLHFRRGCPPVPIDSQTHGLSIGKVAKGAMQRESRARLQTHPHLLSKFCINRNILFEISAFFPFKAPFNFPRKRSST